MQINFTAAFDHIYQVADNLSMTVNNTNIKKSLHINKQLCLCSYTAWAVFEFELDCIIKIFEAKTEWSDFSFVKLYNIKQLK